MSAIAKAYWRSVKRGARAFADVPDEMQYQVIALARQDLENGAITEEQYVGWIGAEVEA